MKTLNSIFKRITSLSGTGSLQLFQLVRYATFIFIGIGLVKLGLVQSEIGSFETFLLISGMFTFFWVSGIVNSMLAVYPNKTEEERRKLLFNTFISLAGFSVVASLLLVLLSKNVLSFLHKTETEQTILFAAVYLLLNSPSFLVEYILFLNEKKKAILYYAVFISLLTLLIVLLPAAFQLGIAYSVAGLLIVALLKIIVLCVLLKKYSTVDFNLSSVLENLRLSLPLMLSIFVSGSSEYIDGIIVKSKFDNMFFAIYRYGAKELPVLLIVANTFSTAMIPAVSKNLQEGLAEIKTRSTQMMHLFFPLTLALMIFSPLIYRLVFSDSFSYSAIIFNIYLLLIIPRVLFPQTILTGIQQPKFLLVSSLMEITINVSVSIYLANKIGLPGVAAGTFIAYCFDKIFLILVNRFVYKIELSSYVRLLPFVGYSILTLLVFAFSYVLMLKGVWAN